jgi:type III secretory pathway lipoprotein EscJ
MATAAEPLLDDDIGARAASTPKYWETPMGKKVVIGGAIAAAMAVIAAIWLWSSAPDYKVLFSNFSDRDGGAITASLDQMGIKYKFSEGGTAILIPAEQVPSVRLKLAAQGLPRAGNVGFELLENQKLGTSQFVEQVNYQRSLEGELANSIQAVSAVSSARVHLALPKPSVFVREQQKPTASVLLNLQPGRSLDQAQVSAIVHLVASSVPELTPSNVTVVDQNGNLLSDASGQGRQAARPEPAEVRRGPAAEHRQAGRVDDRPDRRPEQRARRGDRRSGLRPGRHRRRDVQAEFAAGAAGDPQPADLGADRPGQPEPVRRPGRAVEPAAGRGHRADRRRRCPQPASSKPRPPARPARTPPPTTKSTRPCASSRSRWAASSA